MAATIGTFFYDLTSATQVKVTRDNDTYSTCMPNKPCYCCGSILSLVQILISFVLGYGNVL